MRTRMLAAGFAALLAGATTGCWTPSRPMTSGPNSHIPKTNTNTNAGFPPGTGNTNAGGAANSGAMNSTGVNNNGVNAAGTANSRTTGMPTNPATPGVNLTSAAMANTPGTIDGPGYLRQQPALGGAGGPIANNANAAMNRSGVTPASSLGTVGRNNDPLPPPDPAPGSDLTTAPLAPAPVDGAFSSNPRYRRSPQFPADTTVQPNSPPPPAGTARGTDPLFPPPSGR